jgi:hypothetical protein
LNNADRCCLVHLLLANDTSQSMARFLRCSACLRPGSVDAQGARALRIRLLRAPEHQLLEFVLFLRCLESRHCRRRGCLRPELLAGFCLWPERVTHELRQALDTGSFAPTLGYNCRIKSAGSARGVALTDVSSAGTAKVAVRAVRVGSAKHGRPAAGEGGNVISGNANFLWLLACGARRHSAVVVDRGCRRAEARSVE